MASEWYFKSGETLFGPLSSAALRKFVAKGTLKPSDLVRKGSEGEWITAKTVKGLFKEHPPGRSSDSSNSAKPQEPSFASMRDASERVRLIWLGIRITSGAVMLIFGLYQLFFGGILWPIKKTTYFAGGVNTTLTRATPLLTILIIGVLLTSLFLLVSGILKLRAEACDEN